MDQLGSEVVLLASCAPIITTLFVDMGAAELEMLDHY
jgi:hypothetical protein